VHGEYVTSRLVAGLPNEQKQPMRRTRYPPTDDYMILTPDFRKGYDNWVARATPSPTSSVPKVYHSQQPLLQAEITTFLTFYHSSPLCANPSVPILL